MRLEGGQKNARAYFFDYVLPPLAIVMGAAFFLMPAFFNAFPFMFPDASDYLRAAPKIYRSPYYGLLIGFFHRDRFVWAPVLMQAVATSHLLWVALKIGNGDRFRARSFVLLSAALTLFSSLPFFVGFMMPDIFTGLMFVAMYLIAFHLDELSPLLLGYLLLLASLAAVVHLTHVPLALGLVAVFFGLWIFLGYDARSILKQLCLALLPLAVAFLALFLFNLFTLDEATIWPAGSTFLMANMIEAGPAKDYLTDACPGAGFKICPYIDQFPEDADAFLWDSEMFELIGGFPGMGPEAKQIVMNTVMTRPYAVIRMGLRNFGRSLVTHAPGFELRPRYELPLETKVLGALFGPRVQAAYLASGQMRDTLPLAFESTVDNGEVPLYVISLIVLTALSYRRAAPQSFALGVGCLAFVLGDALFCSFVSGVHDRYQARVTWLLLFATLMIALDLTNRTGGARPPRAPERVT